MVPGRMGPGRGAPGRSDSPGIARLRSCASQRWEREYELRPTPCRPSETRPPSPGEGWLHPPVRRVRAGNPRIFRMPPELFFLVNQGAGKKGKASRAWRGGLGRRLTASPLPAPPSAGGKLSPRTLNPNHLARRPSSSTVLHGSAAAPTPQMQN